MIGQAMTLWQSLVVVLVVVVVAKGTIPNWVQPSRSTPDTERKIRHDGCRYLHRLWYGRTEAIGLNKSIWRRERWHRNHLT